MTLQLRHLDVKGLIGSAGGDPWQMNRTIQAGSPGEISELATAFRAASICTSETTEEFLAAQRRFELAWDRHDGGDHPINDSAEVSRATESLQYNKDKMSKVAVDLQSIAASLAEAQRSGAISISNLDGALRRIDDQIDYEISLAAANGETADISELTQAAVDRVATALDEVRSVRDAYSDQLDQARAEMAAEGYTPDSTNGTDGRALDSEPGAKSASDKYDTSQRAADQALVDAPGPWTPEKQAAAGRLRDFATINDPAASIDEIQYAGQRLGDYNMSHFTGPLPVDPITGKTAAQRAAFRQEWQQKLEQGVLGAPPMSPDQATRFLNQQETTARNIVIDGVETKLRETGISEKGIAGIVKSLSTGADMVGTGFERYGESVPTGRHTLEGLSKADAELLSKAGFKLSAVGNVVQLGFAGWEWWHSDSHDRNEKLGEATGSVGGSILGGAAAGAAVGSVAGPISAAGAAVVGGLLGGFAGGDIGGDIGGLFDAPLTNGSGGGGKSW